MEGVNAEKQQVLLLDINEVNKRIKEALYSVNAGCPETVLYELSQASYHGVFMQHISKAIWSCLKSRASRWQRIQKALSLLTYLALNGSDTCLHEILTNLDAITSLHNLRFPSNQRDIGYLISEKARNLVNLVCDRQELQARRKEASDLRSRIVSVSSTNGRVETQVIHKPIYAIDSKSTFGKSALIMTNPKPHFITKLMGETMIHRKLADMFNSARKDRKPQNKTTSPFPMQSMMEYWPKENYRHNKPEISKNPKLGQNTRSYDSSDSYTTDNSTYFTSSSDDEKSASDSDYSVHHHHHQRGGIRSIEDHRNFVDSVSNSSSTSISDSYLTTATTDGRKEVYTENTTGHHVGYHGRESNRTELPESYHRIVSKPYDREPRKRYTEDPNLDMKEDYEVRSGRPVELHHRYDINYPMYQMAIRNTKPDKRVDAGYDAENHQNLRYNVHTTEKGANPFAGGSRY